MSTEDGGFDDDEAIVIDDPVTENRVIGKPAASKPPLSVVKFSKLDKVKAKGLFGDQILEAAAAPVDWVWSPSIAAGTTVTIGGPPTSGKSTLLFLFLAARASSKPIAVLGRTVKPAPKNQHIIVVEEQNGQGASRKLLRAVKSLGLDPKEIAKRIVLLARDPVIVGDSTWLDVVGAVGEGHVSDIVVDTLANTTKEEANDEQQQIALYRQFRKALNAAPKESPSRPVLWIVGHTRKGDDSDVSIKDLSGHHQRVAQTDTLLMLEVIRGGSGQQVAARCHFAKERDNLDGHSEPIRFDQYGQPYERGDRSSKAPSPKPKDLGSRIINAVEQDPNHSVTSLSKTLACGHVTIEKELLKLVAPMDASNSAKLDAEAGPLTCSVYPLRGIESGSGQKPVNNEIKSAGNPAQRTFSGLSGTPLSGLY